MNDIYFSLLFILFLPVFSSIIWYAIIRNKNHRLKLAKIIIFERLFSSSGRCNRVEYWLTLLIQLNIMSVFIYSLLMLFQDSINKPTVLLVIIFLFWYISIICSSIRRLHDIGSSGWIYLIVHIFFPIGNLILGLLKGEQEENKYGPPPK